MVAELLKRQLLVITLGFLSGSFVISGSCSSLILSETMLGPKGLQPSTFEGGLDDLESFQAWAEEIKTYMSQANPASVRGPWTDCSFQGTYRRGWVGESFTRCLKENHRALRVLQAKIARASGMTEAEACRSRSFNEEAPPEADARPSSIGSLNSILTSFRYKMKAASLGTSWFKRPRGRPSFK